METNNYYLEYTGAELDAAIGRVLRGGESGGSSGETCTVTVQSFEDNIKEVRYFAFENGNLTEKFQMFMSLNRVSELTLNNVVRGTYVKIISSYESCHFTYTGNVYCFNGGNTSCEFVPRGDVSIDIANDN